MKILSILLVFSTLALFSYGQRSSSSKSSSSSSRSYSKPSSSSSSSRTSSSRSSYSRPSSSSSSSSSYSRPSRSSSSYSRPSRSSSSSSSSYSRPSRSSSSSTSSNYSRSSSRSSSSSSSSGSSSSWSNKRVSGTSSAAPSSSSSGRTSTSSYAADNVSDDVYSTPSEPTAREKYRAAKREIRNSSPGMFEEAGDHVNTTTDKTSTVATDDTNTNVDPTDSGSSSSGSTSGSGSSSSSSSSTAINNPGGVFGTYGCPSNNAAFVNATSYTNRRWTVRNNKHVVKVKSDVIILEIWDDEKEDGDIVSLNLNGVEVLDYYYLRNNKKRITVAINKNAENVLVLHAHNLGDIPPNTCAINVIDGNRTRTLDLTSTMTDSGAIKMVYIGN